MILCSYDNISYNYAESDSEATAAIWNIKSDQKTAQQIFTSTVWRTFQNIHSKLENTILLFYFLISEFDNLVWLFSVPSQLDNGWYIFGPNSHVGYEIQQAYAHTTIISVHQFSCGKKISFIFSCRQKNSFIYFSSQEHVHLH